MEDWALRQRGRVVAAALVMTGIYAGLVLMRCRDRADVLYDEPPPDAIQTLGLDGPLETTVRLANEGG